tara:strand:+ start:501 stop:785 length:285 start_codon:yes stop_codon:yes gene_type:complete
LIRPYYNPLNKLILCVLGIANRFGLCQYYLIRNADLERINPMTQEQLLDMKFYAQQLQESLAIAYWATADHDKKWHTDRSIDHINKIFSIKESA